MGTVRIYTGSSDGMPNMLVQRDAIPVQFLDRVALLDAAQDAAGWAFIEGVGGRRPLTFAVKEASIVAYDFYDLRLRSFANSMIYGTYFNRKGR